MKKKIMYILDEQAPAALMLLFPNSYLSPCYSVRGEIYIKIRGLTVIWNS